MSLNGRVVVLWLTFTICYSRINLNQSIGVDKGGFKMKIKLFDSELKVMNVLWQKGDLLAKEIVKILGEEVGWSNTTTYTIIKKCIDKGAIERREGFVCHALVTQEEAQDLETEELINKMYNGSSDLLIASLLGRKKMDAKKIEKLKKLVEVLED